MVFLSIGKDVTKLRAIFRVTNNDIARLHNRNIQKVYDALCHNSATTKQLSSIVGLNWRTVDKILNELREKYLIKTTKIGSAYWHEIISPLSSSSPLP